MLKTQVIGSAFSTLIPNSQSKLVTDNVLNCSVTHLPVYQWIQLNYQCVSRQFHIELHSCIVNQYRNDKRCLTLKAPIATKVICFSHLLKFLRSLYDKQCGPRSDCSYTLFASILNSSVIVRTYFQQTTSADNIFRCIFSWGFKG